MSLHVKSLPDVSRNLRYNSFSLWLSHNSEHTHLTHMHTVNLTNIKYAASNCMNCLTMAKAFFVILFFRSPNGSHQLVWNAVSMDTSQGVSQSGTSTARVSTSMRALKHLPFTQGHQVGQTVFHMFSLDDWPWAVLSAFGFKLLNICHKNNQWKPFSKINDLTQSGW